MSDDDHPDNLRHLPRIGSPPLPDLPPPPDLTTLAASAPEGSGDVRISPFDAPEVPHVPAPPAAVTTALRSEGTEPSGAPDAGSPQPGALSLAAILAIALAAFEGMQTWIQENGPRRAEAARHQREMELLAAKADADAARLRAEAGAVRAKSRVPSSHDYGRSALGRGSVSRGGRSSGGPSGGGMFGRGSGHGTGPAAPGRGRNGSTSTGSQTTSGRNGQPRGRNDGAPSRNSGGGSRNGSLGPGGLLSGRRGSGKSGTGGGSGTGGSGGAGRSRTGGGASGSAGGGSTGRSGDSARRSPRQAVADWWKKGKTSRGTTAAGGGTGSAGAAVRSAVRNAKPGPTFWDAAGDKPRNRWKQATPAARGEDTGKGSRSGRRNSARNWRTPGGRGDRRVTFKDAVADAFADRWKRRRDQWAAAGGPRRAAKPGVKSGGADEGTDSNERRFWDAMNDYARRHAGAGGAQPGADARSSPFDDAAEPEATYTVEQDGPARSNRTPGQPNAVVRQGPPALPRAPQRPAGPRPGTTRPKEPIPMPAAASRPAAAPGRMPAQHATDITLDVALRALTLLTSSGMRTYDDCDGLAKHSRQLLGELETMAQDLRATHNVSGRRTHAGLAQLMEQVGELVRQADRMAKACLEAAELAEAEESQMARHYRPTQDATIDAGLLTPSARIHNEN
ncbi:hypothetical protein OG933_45160 (plasmid) [Streptomyces sp. NBC_00016]|uniref:hypothetical protein n=1 Tax=Streptomyces sp. NBC_00016 TaxID=2975622 RepID=UPI002F90B2B1